MDRIVSEVYTLHKEKFWTKVLAVFAAFCLPFEEYYVFGTHINLNYVVMLFSLVFVFSKKPIRHLGLRRIFFVMCVIYLMLSFLTLLLHLGDTWYNDSALKNIVFAIPVTFIILYFYTDSFSVKTFLKWGVIIALLGTVIIIYQRFSFLLFGDYYSNFSIDFIPGIEFGREESLEVQIRPCAFFSEPAHYAEFCLPILVFLLLKRKMLFAVIISFGMLISGSTIGFVGLLAAWVCSFFIDSKGSLCSSRNILGLVFVLVLIFFLYRTMNYYYPEIMEFQMRKMDNTDVDDTARMLGSLPILKHFDTLEWVFGIGIGNKDAYIQAFNINVAVANGEKDNFTNTFFSLLVFFGIVGFVVFFIFMCKLYAKCCKGSQVTYIFIMLLLFFSSNFIFAGNLLYYVFFVANTKYIEKCDNLFEPLSIWRKNKNHIRKSVG